MPRALFQNLCRTNSSKLEYEHEIEKAFPAAKLSSFRKRPGIGDFLNLSQLVKPLEALPAQVDLQSEKLEREWLCRPREWSYEQNENGVLEIL